MMIEIVAELGALLLFPGDNRRDEMGVLPQVVTHFRQQRGVFRETLHQDIARAVEGRFAVGNAFVGIHEGRCKSIRILRRIVPQRIGQRLKTGFNSDLPARAAFRFVGKIEIFEFSFAQGAVNRLRQLIAQFALLADRFQDCLAALFQLAQVAETGFQLTQLRVVQTAGHLFTVTRDKRDRVAFIKQANGGFHLFGSCLKFTRNNAAERIIHHVFHHLLNKKSGDSYTD